ncbi:MAG: sodium:solute symporter family transporter, partial [Pirellulales bacterium]
MRWTCLVALLLFASAHGDADRAAGAEVLRWSELPPLPDQHGFAGPFVGVSGDALLVAGGANFPAGRPWDGHPKVYHDDLYVLRDPQGTWQRMETTLPGPRAYGMAVTWQDAVVCLGGSDGSTHSDEAFLLRRGEGGVRVEPLPSLPRPVAFTCGVVLDDTVYVAGGRESPDAKKALHTFWALDLSQPETGWRELPAWPGPPRILAVAGALDEAVYLFSGSELIPGPDGETTRRFLKDAYRYRPGEGWRRIADLPRSVTAAPTPAVRLGADQLAVIGGADGTRFDQADQLRDAHPGFSNEVLAYNTVTDAWSVVGHYPKRLEPDAAEDPQGSVWPPVTTATTRWRDRVVVASGEVRPGVRTRRVFWAEPNPAPARFGALNWAVLVAYLAVLVVIGFYFSRREKGTGDYFLAGRRVPWWAAGLSIFGTQLSAITYLAIPAKSYSSDWKYFLINVGILAIAPVVILVFLPFYRRLNVTTAYEYLGLRFGPSLRVLGSLLFSVFQIGRMGVVVLLPALALAAVTGINVYVCIALMGVLSTIYTVAGGIEAVIWTDVLQVLVLLFGAVLAIGLMVGGVQGGFGTLFEEAAAHGKFQMADWSWDLTTDSLAVVILGAIFTNLVPYTSDQAVVQRYLTTPTERMAARSIWTNALLAIPASVLFFGVGTAMFVFYRLQPQLLEPLEQTDQIFPWFIAHQMPAGLAGLVIAGVFAAAMSSLDSSMHSVATTLSSDIYRRVRPGGTEAHHLAVARWLTAALGLLGTAAAMILATFPVESLWDVFLAVVGLFGGTMAGLFALGMLTRR